MNGRWEPCPRREPKYVKLVTDAMQPTCCMRASPMSDRYPDDDWLVDFARRLHDGRLLTHKESLALSAELRWVHVERDELRAALEPLQIQLSQHHHTPHVDACSMLCQRSAMKGRVKPQRRHCAGLCNMSASELSRSGRSWTRWRRLTMGFAASLTKLRMATSLRHGGGCLINRS